MFENTPKLQLLFLICLTLVIVSCSGEPAPEPTLEPTFPPPSPTAVPPTESVKPTSAPVQDGELFGCIYMLEEDEQVPAYCDEQFKGNCSGIFATAIDKEGEWLPRDYVDGNSCYSLKLPPGEHSVLGAIFYNFVGMCDQSYYQNQSETVPITLESGQKMELDFIIVQPNLDSCR